MLQATHEKKRTLPSPTASRPAGRPSPRDPFFDNAKYLAIVLVAVAHTWELVMDGSHATRALYMFVYMFHMPAFVLISGYFSRSFTGRPDQLKRLLTSVLVPYVVFEVVYSLYERYANDPHQPISLTDPVYLTWFLCALFIWRLSTPLWQLLRGPLPILLSLVVAALATTDDRIGPDLNLQRVFQFLPFFVLGLSLRPEHFALVRRRAARIAAVPVLLGSLVVAWLAADRVRLDWFYRSSAAQSVDQPAWTGPLVMLVMVGGGLLLTAAFLAWVPGRRTWFTVLGTGTICGYLLHGLLVKTLVYLRVVEHHDWLASPGGRVLLTAGAATAVTLLCTPPVHRALRWATEPRMTWAFKPQQPRR
ncbi:acyltransferase family protein [Streptomyces sp. LP05-1]|uniref:Acyltransferase family protein n=1 Tax=Streptomyces pyxinae TaxID=2970734 RepID=A0ABT2CKX7_9ACTN|nr:acyltransferase family protein [Streptomyces sp. LP05-1]MCS0638078.1 acyltransferase family protein [Streptomyces sp. LP05-1]